jgi:RNA polymerase-binding transcription factor DksA
MPEPKTYLTDEQLEHFREKLQDRYDTIRGDLEGVRSDADDEDNTERTQAGHSDAPTHPADAGTDEYSREKQRQLAQSQRAELRRIEEAMRRIEKRTYGLCVSDGARIEMDRLEARPWSRLCLSCARESEA